MRIPDVRDAMLDLANRIEARNLTEEARQLRDLEAELYRRPPVRGKRAKPTAVSVDDRITREVKLLADSQPNMPYREIAKLFNIDGGRVSQILAGFRE